MKEEVIYFILDTYSSAVKIGYTTIKGLRRRLQTLQTGAPYELRLLGALWGDKKIEKEIHKKFKHSHIRGEWFEYSEEIEDYIAKSWDFSVIESFEPNIHKKLTNKPNEVEYGKQL